MFSFGIRFGQGFDRLSVLKVMQSVPTEFDYDFLVVGSNPSGVACAREATAAGKKTAIIKWQKHTPAEEEGFSENLEEMERVLETSEKKSAAQHPTKSDDSVLVNFKNSKNQNPSIKSTSFISKGGSYSKTHWPWQRNKHTSRRVRRSRLDLNNELFKRGQQCRKLMYNASNMGEVVTDAKKCGWRVFGTTPSLSLNWNKMTEDIMDYVMEENWKLMSILTEEKVEIMEGWVTFVNNHTVKVKLFDEIENEITAEMICIAPVADYVFPVDVMGAENYGINCDDFHRMSEPPGKTLIVGSIPEAMECAGIVANCRFPVTVVSRSKLLKGHDSEISRMIINDLKKRGVVFREETSLRSVEISPEDGTKLLASFAPNTNDNNTLQETEDLTEENFDTILFAVGKRIPLNSLKVRNAGITYDPVMEKITTNNLDATSVPNIYALGEVVAHQPGGLEISELAGKLLGKRLFSNGSDIMDYSTVPQLLLTPTEYAFVGLSEDAALYRLGAECVSVYYGSFRPLDFVIPAKNDECFAKVIAFKPRDTVIGLHFYGPQAGEMIQGFAAAMKNGLTMSQLQTLVGVPTTKAQEILKLKNLKVSVTEPETAL